MGDTATKAKSALSNATEKIEEHPVLTALAGAAVIYAGVKLATPKKEDDE